MTLRQIGMTASAIALAICLAACGGGGGSGGGVSSIPPPQPLPPPPHPPPPPPPPPPPDTSVELLAAPPTGEFAVLATGDPLQIRYDPTSEQYQLLANGEDWTPLVDDPVAGSTPNIYFVFGSHADRRDDSDFVVEVHHRSPSPANNYRYSNIALWSLRSGSTESQRLRGTVAFGLPTRPDAVPISGTGIYQGRAAGLSNFTSTSWGGPYPNAPIRAEVTLIFDFGRGSLSGSMQPYLGCDCDDGIDFPRLDFVDTVFGVGSPTYSGRFQTGLSGPNGFSGRFTGPAAQELIGSWAFPFTHNGSVYSAEGGWIAKRGQ